MLLPGFLPGVPLGQHEERPNRVSEGALKLVKQPDIDQISGAARVYVDGHGWRWLLPHAGGSFAALEVLTETDDAADWQWLKAHVADASAYQRALLVRHFASTEVAADVAESCNL